LDFWEARWVRTSGPFPAWAAELYRQVGRQQFILKNSIAEIDSGPRRGDTDADTERALCTLNSPIGLWGTGWVWTLGPGPIRAAKLYRQVGGQQVIYFYQYTGLSQKSRTTRSRTGARQCDPACARGRLALAGMPLMAEKAARMDGAQKDSDSRNRLIRLAMSQTGAEHRQSANNVICLVSIVVG
jgi:hypothetical protein